MYSEKNENIAWRDRRGHVTLVRTWSKFQRYIDGISSLAHMKQQKTKKKSNREWVLKILLHNDKK